jgi:hypothetical protein
MCMSAKPWWWKPLWIAVLLSTIALGVADYFLFHIPLERVAGSLAITLLAIGFSYYIRIKPSTKVNRATYIILGICGTFLVTLFGGAFIIQAIDLPPIPTYLTYLWSWLSFIVLMIASPIAGAFIGDWIGKRMNYRLPLSLGDENNSEKNTME